MAKTAVWLSSFVCHRFKKKNCVKHAYFFNVRVISVSSHLAVLQKFSKSNNKYEVQISIAVNVQLNSRKKRNNNVKEKSLFFGKRIHVTFSITKMSNDQQGIITIGMQTWRI